MARLETFSGLTKKQEDVLKKYYCYGSLALLNVNVVNNKFTFHTRVSEKANKNPLASAWIQVKNDLLLLKAKKRNDRVSSYRLDVTPEKLLKNFKASFECKLLKNGSVDPSISAEYSDSQAKGKLTYYTKPSALRAQATVGKNEYGAGLDLKYELDSHHFTTYDLAAWWFKKGSKFVIKHVGKDFGKLDLGDLEISYYQKISALSHIGSKVVSNLKTRDTSIEVGGDYKYDANSLVKAKINSDGAIGLAFARKISNKLTASVATQVTAQSLLGQYNEPYKFGLRFDFSG